MYCSLLFYIIVPNEYSSSITVNPDKSYYDIGSSIVLHCNVLYHKSLLIDVKTSLFMEWSYINGIKNTAFPLNDNAEHTINYTINNIKLSDAGQYTCSYYINTLVDHLHILHSANKTIYTNITAASK